MESLFLSIALLHYLFIYNKKITNDFKIEIFFLSRIIIHKIKKQLSNCLLYTHFILRQMNSKYFPQYLVVQTMLSKSSERKSLYLIIENNCISY